MRNAKEELLDELKDTAKIKCALIKHERLEDDAEAVPKVLKLNYTESGFNEFVNSLDFRYDDGYGIQELYGTVWLEDGTWLSREEYDGAEYWRHNVLPTIPIECI